MEALRGNLATPSHQGRKIPVMARMMSINGILWQTNASFLGQDIPHHRSIVACITALTENPCDGNGIRTITVCTSCCTGLHCLGLSLMTIPLELCPTRTQAPMHAPVTHLDGEVRVLMPPLPRRQHDELHCTEHLTESANPHRANRVPPSARSFRHQHESSVVQIRRELACFPPPRGESRLGEGFRRDGQAVVLRHSSDPHGF